MTRDQRGIRIRASVPVLLGAASFLLASHASATTIWLLEGIVRTQDSGTTFSAAARAAGIDYGVPISGWFEFDTTVADSDPATDQGTYSGALIAGHISVGQFEIDLSMNGFPGSILAVNTFRVINGKSTSRISGLAAADLTAPSNLDPLFGFFELMETDPVTVVTDAFPDPPPALSVFDAFDECCPSPYSTSFGFATQQTALIRAEITSLVVVPEPSTAVLVGAGLIAQAIALQRRRRNRD